MCCVAVRVQVGTSQSAAMRFTEKLMSSFEEGQELDRGQVVKELANISKFVAGAGCSGGASVSLFLTRAPPSLQPAALGSHFLEPGGNHFSEPGGTRSSRRGTRLQLLT